MARRADARFGLPPHVQVVRKKSGVYYYFHEKRNTVAAGKRVPLPGQPFAPSGMPDERWWELYRAAAGSAEVQVGPGTFSALARQYRDSTEWSQFSERTREEKARLVAKITEVWGELVVRRVAPHHIVKLRDRFKDTPATANNVMNTLSALLSWGVLRGFCDANPMLTMRLPKLKGEEPYEAWEWHEIELLLEQVPQQIRDVSAVALYTGQRQADVLKMKVGDIGPDGVFVRQNKTGKRLRIAMHPQLRPVVARLVRGRSAAEALVLRSAGEAWSPAQFKRSWNYHTRKGELGRVIASRRLVFHGLRKSAVVMLLDAGCTVAEVASVTGQSFQMVAHYAKDLDQRRLARVAMEKWAKAMAA